MGQVTLYAHAAGNWSAIDGWNDAANGLGTHYTNPQNGTPAGTTYDCVLNSLAMVADVDITVDAIRAPATDIGILTVSGTRTINVGSTNGIIYGHTLVAGMVVVPTGTNLIVNGQVVNSSTGNAIVTAGTAGLTANNGTNTLFSASAGRALLGAGTGVFNITGHINNSGATAGATITSTNVNHTLHGNLSCSGSGSALALSGGTWAWTPGAGVSVTMTSTGGNGLALSGGTVDVIDNLTTSDLGTGNGRAIIVAGGTLNYTGSRTLASGADCCIGMSSGAVNLATATAALALANSGSFVVMVRGGTLTTTAAGGTASVVNQNATSYAAIPGGTAANKAIITGPTLPGAAVVKVSGSVQYGYAGGLYDGTFNGPDPADIATICWAYANRSLTG